jgi:hypothetical protein
MTTETPRVHDDILHLLEIDPVSGLPRWRERPEHRELEEKLVAHTARQAVREVGAQ